jgi:EpsI family protein
MKTRLLVIGLCLLSASVAAHRASTPEAVPPRASLSTFPAQVGEWRAVAAPRFENSIVQVLGVDDYLNRVYATASGATLGLYIGYYASQRQGDTIHSPLNCLPGGGWEPMKKERIPLTFAGPVRSPQTVTVNRILVQKGLSRAVVIYWYQSHGRVIASEYWGKAYMVADAIRLNRTDGALVRVIAPVSDAGAAAVAAADRQAGELARDIAPLLGRYVPA